MLWKNCNHRLFFNRKNARQWIQVTVMIDLQWTNLLNDTTAKNRRNYRSKPKQIQETNRIQGKDRGEQKDNQTFEKRERLQDDDWITLHKNSNKRRLENGKSLAYRATSHAVIEWFWSSFAKVLRRLWQDTGIIMYTTLPKIITIQITGLWGESYQCHCITTWTRSSLHMTDTAY